VSSPIELRLFPSLAAGSLAAMPWLALAGFILIAAPESSLWLLLFLLPVAGIAVCQFRRYGLLLGSKAVVALGVNAGNQLVCEFVDGRLRTARIGRSSSLGAVFVLLNLHPVDARSERIFVLILGPCSLFTANAAETEFRRLRMWLRAGQPEIAH